MCFQQPTYKNLLLYFYIFFFGHIFSIYIDLYFTNLFKSILCVRLGSLGTIVGIVFVSFGSIRKVVRVYNFLLWSSLIPGDCWRRSVSFCSLRAKFLMLWVWVGLVFVEVFFFCLHRKWNNHFKPFQNARTCSMKMNKALYATNRQHRIITTHPTFFL